MAGTTTKTTFGGATGNSYSSTTTQLANSQPRNVERLIESLDFLDVPLQKMFASGEVTNTRKVEWTDENFAPISGTFTAAITDTSGTAWSVTTGHGARVQVYDLLKVDDEILYVSAVATDALTVTRGYSGSTAATHAAGVTFDILGPAVPENVDSPSSPITRGALYSNFCQIFDYAFQVSDRQNNADNYLIRGKEYNYELAKKYKEAARDLERTLIMGLALDAATTLPSTMGGYLSYITQRTTAKAGATVNEGDLMDLLQTVWSDVGPESQGRTVLSGIFFKRVVGSWTDGMRRVDGTTTKVTTKLDALDTDFGRLEFVPHFHQPANVAAIINPKQYTICRFAGTGAWHDEPLAKSGAYQKAHLYGDYSLKAAGDRASAKITGFSITKNDYPTLVTV